MHTYEGKKETTFNFFGDFSGEIEISVYDENRKLTTTVSVPATDILEFIAYEYIAERRISKLMSKLEKMSWRELLDYNDKE